MGMFPILRRSDTDKRVLTAGKQDMLHHFFVHGNATSCPGFPPLAMEEDGGAERIYIIRIIVQSHTVIVLGDQFRHLFSGTGSGHGLIDYLIVERTFTVAGHGSVANREIWKSCPRIRLDAECGSHTELPFRSLQVPFLCFSKPVFPIYASADLSSTQESSIPRR